MNIVCEQYLINNHFFNIKIILITQKFIYFVYNKYSSNIDEINIDLRFADDAVNFAQDTDLNALLLQ